MMLQRLATGATRVKQARYRRRGSEALARACAVYTLSVCAYIAIKFYGLNTITACASD